MPPSIPHHPAFLAALRGLTRTQGEMQVSITRLSSGLRINGAADDAVGLAQADRLSAQIRGLGRASRNVNEGITLSQVADGALASIAAGLQRMRELAVQASNASLSGAERGALQLEVVQLQGELGALAAATAYNGIKLLDGSFASRTFQVGARVGETAVMAAIASLRPEWLGIYRGFSVRDQSFGIGGNGSHPLSVSIGGGPAISLGNPANDAAAIVAAINHAQIAGLVARAKPTIVPAVASSAQATQSGRAIYTVNGVDIGIVGASGAAALGANRASAVSAINAASAATGVIASDTGSGVTLTAPDGRNVLLAFDAGTFVNAQASDFGLPSIWITGSNGDFDYEAPAGVAGTVSFTYGWVTNAYAIGSTGVAVSAMNVSSVAGAEAAIRSLDAALAAVGTSRAGVGATQNRFASILESIEMRSSDLTRAHGRLIDADFALETARLARNQVLQDSGLAMLAQANALPRQVLTLLRQL